MDQVLITAINNIRVTLGEINADDYTFGNEIMKIANETTYNNGNILGQYGRFETVAKTAARVRRDRELLSLYDFTRVNPIGLEKSRAYEFADPQLLPYADY